MNHIRHRADHIHGIEHRNRLRRVRHGDGYAIVFAHARRAQRAGAFRDIGDRIGISGRRAHEIIGDQIGVLRRDPFHRFDHGAFLII